MAEFRYDRSFNAPAWVGSIADIIRRQGEIPAEAALRIGQIQGQGAQQSGLAYAAAINHVGGDVSNALLQATDPRRKLDDMRLRQAQQLEQGQGVVDQALTPYQPTGPQPEGAGPTPAQHSYLDEHGLTDIPKLNAVLAANGLAHLAPELTKGAEAQNESLVKYQQTQQQAAQQHAIALGDAAHNTLQLINGGMTPLQAMDFGAEPLLRGQAIKPEEFQQQRAQLAQLPPDQQIAWLTNLRDQAERLAPPKTLAEGAKEIGRYGSVLGENPKIEKPKPVEKASFGLTGPDGTVQNVEGMFDPNANAGKGAYTYLGKDVSDQVVKPASEKNPPSPDEQLLEAMRKGDTAAVTTITNSMRAAAQAKSDPSALAAANRQIAAITAQAAQQGRAQSFQEAQAGRKELTDKYEQPLQTARASADTLREVVASAKAGNKVAASLQSLEATMAAIRAQGLNRINTTEIGVTADAGNLYDRISGKIGKVLKGQPVPADLQGDMLQFADILEKSAYKKYSEGFDSITKRYPLPNETKIPPGGAPAKGTLRNGATWDYREGQWGWWK